VPTAELQLGRSRLLSMYAGTVGLTLSNPTTIIGFTTILMSAGGLEAIGGIGGGLTALGMVMGSVLVWIVFTTVVILAGRFVSAARLVWLNRIAGALFLYFAAGTLWAVLRPWVGQ
jgi:threonine/homoserine/homoserine lactone efflux protein